MKLLHLLTRSIKVNSIWLLLSLWTISCGKKEYNKEDYLAWYKNSESVEHTVNMGNYKFKARYLSPELRQIWALKQGEQATLDSLSRFLCFSYDFSTKEERVPFMHFQAEDEEAYNNRLSYLLSKAQEDFQLQLDDESLPCVLYHLEHTYQLGPYTRAMLLFEIPKKLDLNQVQHCILTYNDNILQVGRINHAFPSFFFKSLPELKLQ